MCPKACRKFFFLCGYFLGGLLKGTSSKQDFYPQLACNQHCRFACLQQGEAAVVQTPACPGGLGIIWDGVLGFLPDCWLL